MNNAPGKFDFGRFKLESYYLFPGKEYGTCTLVLNGSYIHTVRLDIYKENIKNITEYINNELQKGNSIPVQLNSQIYDLRIEDKTWVYMERKSE